MLYFGDKNSGNEHVNTSKDKDHFRFQNIPLAKTFHSSTQLADWMWAILNWRTHNTQPVSSTSS